MIRTGFEIIVRTKHDMVSVPGLSLKELSRLCDCPSPVILRLYQFGLFEPLSEAAEPLFSRNSVFRIRKALRLKRDLHLNLDAVAIVIELLDRIEELERQVGR